MRWEDERYVRVYTRDTVDWLGLSFIAQGLFCLILRKVDRAGLLNLGKHGKRAVAIVIGFPGDWPRLEPALEELLADGCVKVQGEYLVVPNFIEAQEATQSDAQRKRESRGRARDIAASEEVLNPDKTSGNVTGGHGNGQKVTRGHAASQPVTPNCAVPSVPSVPSEETPPTARVTRLPTRQEALASEHPRTAALLAVLAETETPGAWARDGETRRLVEAAIGGQDVVEVASRVAASIKANGKPWLGFHIGALKPPSGHPKRDDRSWQERLTADEFQQAHRELASLHPDLVDAPLGCVGDPAVHPVEEIAALNARWRAVAEARTS